MTRGLYKQPGGKLVGVTVRLSHADSDYADSDYADSDYIDSAHTNAVKTVPYAGPAASSTVIECHIDGDFFLDGDDAGTRNLDVYKRQTYGDWNCQQRWTSIRGMILSLIHI